MTDEQWNAFCEYCHNQLTEKKEANIHVSDIYRETDIQDPFISDLKKRLTESCPGFTVDFEPWTSRDGPSRMLIKLSPSSNGGSHETSNTEL